MIWSSVGNRPWPMSVARDDSRWIPNVQTLVDVVDDVCTASKDVKGRVRMILGCEMEDGLFEVLLHCRGKDDLA